VRFPDRRLSTIGRLSSVALGFKAHFNGFSNSLHQFVQGMRLRMATAQCWNRAHVVPLGIPWGRLSSEEPLVRQRWKTLKRAKNIINLIESIFLNPAL
jgi:hypothetical protein